MSKQTVFILKDETFNMDFGQVIFNGKFVFRLNENIPKNLWKKVGFIPLEGKKQEVVSKDLFFYLNSRLPIALRNESSRKKIKYIEENGLRVASDSFVLLPT